MAQDPYIDWIIANLEKPGKTQSGLARHLGLDAGAVNKVIKGRRSLKSNEIAGAAEYFGEDAPLSEVKARPGLVSARLAGSVEAGTFREVEDFDQSEPVEIYVPADERFPNARMLAFDVSGTSMNKLEPRPILPGDRVIGVAFEDVADQVRIRDGMVVVVERTRDGGHFREWSIKQVEFYADRIEFHPRSTDPRHRPIVVMHQADPDDGVKVEIICLVRMVLNELAPF